MRRSSSRFANEQARIERWLDFIHEAAGRDYALAVEIARLQRLIKGYGDTHARGLARYETILAALDRVRSDPAPAASLRRLRDSALQDEEGAALARELSRLAAGGMSATR
jgi:indolepyruvate ferredoxin oxidoreductase beta subunit